MQLDRKEWTAQESSVVCSAERPEELIKTQATKGFGLLRRLWSRTASSSELHKQPHRKGWATLELSVASLAAKPSVMKTLPGIESAVVLLSCFISFGLR